MSKLIEDEELKLLVGCISSGHWVPRSELLRRALLDLYEERMVLGIYAHQQPAVGGDKGGLRCQG